MTGVPLIPGENFQRFPELDGEPLAIDDAPEVRQLHLLAQAYWHDRAMIVGDRKALEMLRQLIDMALESKTAGAEFMVNDGEWYECIVTCVEDPEEWKRVYLPYTDEVARDRRHGSADTNV